MHKVDIVSGFLGAGKTTLIAKLLKEVFADEKVVLIENEFGEIGIDKGFLKESGVAITEMNSGCICCSLVGDFSEALKQVVEELKPDRIIIEPSGVGKLSDVKRAVESVAQTSDVTLNSALCVVDVQKYKVYMRNFKEFFNNQIACADVIVLSRTQQVSEEALLDAVASMRTLNEHAHIITTAWDVLDGKHIVQAMEEESFTKQVMDEEVCPHCHHPHHEHHHCECEHEHHHDHDCECGHKHHECNGHHHDHHHHHADEVFASWGIETPKRYTKEELELILKALSSSEEYGIILRAKGMLCDKDDKWMYFDVVPNEYDIREGNVDYTGKICVIGSNLKEDKLKALFQVE